MKESLLGLDLIGLHNVGKIFRNLSTERLVEEGILNNEVKIGMNGATIVDTGAYTGRSPKDKYFVEENSSKENLWWGSVNSPVREEIFNESPTLRFNCLDNSYPIYISESTLFFLSIRKY